MARCKEQWKPIGERLIEIENELARNVNWASHPEVKSCITPETEVHLHYDKKKLMLVKKLREKIAKLNAKERKDLRSMV